jgi:glycosyltransferase involved in cell wall biosynthesis
VRLAIVDSHPIQYHVPWYRELAQRCELSVLYAHVQSAEGQARAGYGVQFDWDVDLSSGYRSLRLRNAARDPGVHHFRGCDCPELRTTLAELRAEAVIVTGWYLKAFWQTVLACKRLGIPVLVRGDSQLTAQPSALRRGAKQLAYPLLLRGFDGFLSVGARNRAYLEHYRVPTDRIFNSPHVIDVARFAAQAAEAAPRRDELRAEHGAGPQDRIALCVGRLVPFKRCADVIEAVAALGERGARWLVLFVGDGAERDALERRGRELGARVRLLGFRNQSELARLYDAADVLVLSSDARETWGLVVNEAMACGLPAIASDAAGCTPDLIDERLTGFSYPCGDVRALAQRLERGAELRADPESRAALVELSRANSPARAAEMTLDAVRTLLQARGAA